MEQWFSKTQNYVADNVGWFFVLLVNCILFFAIFLGFGKYKILELEVKMQSLSFPVIGWFAMLFSAGMGIGLLFWGVSEPINHFNGNPLISDPGNAIEAAKSAMGISFLHWGIHAWALYAIVGVALAFFTFNKKLPLTIRSVFYLYWEIRFTAP